MNERLEAVYRAASYIVLAPVGPFTIRIDKKTPPLDDLLRQYGTQCWAFVTACNPASQPLTEEENQRREAALERTVREAGYRYVHGSGCDDADHWPAEPSLLILGITVEDAVTLGRRFGQNAILVGEMGAKAQLLWL
jgi:hypothetical protein